MYTVSEEQLFPPGCIIAYLGTQSPEGWVLMTGSPQDNYHGTYDNLRGLGIGSFNDDDKTYTPPNFRGAFLRGAGTNSNTNYSNYEGETSAGSVQTDRVGKHGHNVTDPGHNHTTTYSYEKYNSGGSNNYSGRDGYSAGSNEINSNKTNITIQKSTGGDSIEDETRPFNYSINWILKY